MTYDEFEALTYGVPIKSLIDDSTWYYYGYDEPFNRVRVYKECVVHEHFDWYWGGRNTRSKIEYVDLLRFSLCDFLETFEPIIKKVTKEESFVKLDEKLVEPYTIVGVNFHML